MSTHGCLCVQPEYHIIYRQYYLGIREAYEKLGMGHEVSRVLVPALYRSHARTERCQYR